MAAVGGTAIVRADGKQLRVKGDWTWHLGNPKREGVVGTGVMGYTEMDQIPYVEGKIIDGQGVSFSDITDITDGTIVLELKSGKTIILSNAWFAGEGQGNTESGEFGCRFEGIKAKEVD